MSDGVPETRPQDLQVVHEATRSLLWLQSPRDARRVAIDLVNALGGAVAAAGAPSPELLPLDLSFGAGDPVLPSAPVGSPARAMLDRYLNQFVLDARRVLELADRADRLAESASTDALTGLMNRRMLDRALGRLGSDETVVILDLDHFKQVNDEHGHLAGDEVLRAFGSVLRANLRGRELVGRYGGEEFVLVVAPPSDAEAVLARVRAEWVQHRPLPVTFSAGIASSLGGPEPTLRAADEALYEAKATGRDRWCWADAHLGGLAEPRNYVGPYLVDAIVGNRRPAVQLAIGLRDTRVSEDRIVEDLLAAAQREVGERWYRNEITAADEHLASGVAAAALDALAAEMRPATREGLVVVACAEGDWHSLAAQMFGESLRALGFAVTVLGASTPAAAVADLLERTGASVLAVSCNLPIFFPGAVSLINAAHATGVPVIVGGRAFGDDARRARRLGADAWAADAAGASATLTGWAEQPPTVTADPVLLDAAALRLFTQATSVAADAIADLRLGFPAMAAYDQEQLARTQDDMVFIVQFLAAATLAGDDTIFSSFLIWLHELLLARGVPTAALAAGLSALAPVVAVLEPGAADLLGASVERIKAGSLVAEPTEPCVR